MYEGKEIETHPVKYPRKSSLVPRQNQGINQCHNRKQCVSRQRMDEEARRLRRNETILPCDLTLAGSEFHTVGAATQKARVPAFVFTRGM